MIALYRTVEVLFILQFISVLFVPIPFSIHNKDGLIFAIVFAFLFALLMVSIVILSVFSTGKSKFDENEFEYYKSLEKADQLYVSRSTMIFGWALFIVTVCKLGIQTGLKSHFFLWQLIGSEGCTKILFTGWAIFFWLVVLRDQFFRQIIFNKNIRK